MGRKGKRIDYTNIVRDKNLPILTLDARWHELFPEETKTQTIRELEQKVNNLLKRQGKLVNGIKDMKVLKNNLLKDIVVNMDTGRDPARKLKDRKLDQNQHYIHEINSKTDVAMEELAEIPSQIRLANAELLAESIREIYEQLEENKEELEEVTEWINNIREELKSKILVKQDLEEKNSLIYTYMHDILGAEIMELFDREQYNR